MACLLRRTVAFTLDVERGRAIVAHSENRKAASCAMLPFYNSQVRAAMGSEFEFAVLSTNDR